MRSLAIDTSTGILALAARKDEAWAVLSRRRGLEHSPALLPSIRGLMAEIGLEPAELQLIVCSIGPGSFTGIRIGLATAKGMAMGIPCPLVGVSSLDAYALPYAASGMDVYPLIDARKGRIYTALYREGAREGDYLDCTPEELRLKLKASERVLLTGPDSRELAARFELAAPTAPYADPLALLEAGEARFPAGASEDPVPLYLRKSEAEIGAGL